MVTTTNTKTLSGEPLNLGDLRVFMDSLEGLDDEGVSIEVTYQEITATWED